MRNTGEGAKPPLRYSLNLSAHFRVWVTVWVRRFAHILTHTIFGVFATKKHRKLRFSMLFGAAGQIRTADLILTNHRRAFQPLLYKALRRFFVQKGRGRSLFVPLFPSAHFPVWVTVWVKQLSGRERGAHLRQRQTKPLRPVPLIGNASHFFNKAFLLRCGACPTHTVFAAQLKEYLIKTFFLCIFAAIPRRIRRRSDFIHIHAKHLLAENQSR